MGEGFRVWPCNPEEGRVPITGISTGKYLWVGKICQFTAASICKVLGLTVTMRLMFNTQELLISTCESIHSPYLRFLLLADEITGICLNGERNARPS